MAELAEVRNAVLAWAFQHGLLADTALGDEGIAQGDPSILPFEAQHADYFRTRKIVRVYGDTGRRRHTLKVFSRLRLAKTKIAELQDLFNATFAQSGIVLEVDISKPFKVDQAVQSYGQFVPIHYKGKRIACGSSVGLGNQRNAGTLTALVHTLTGDGLFGISCNHVVGGCSTARPGTPVVVPGIQDVSADHNEIHVIGVHMWAAPMSQGLPSVVDISGNRDLACFRLHDPNRLSSMQGSGDGGYDTPETFAKVKVSLPVKKWGRSTGLTQGRITNILEGGEPVEYNVTSYYGPMNSQVFKGTVYFNDIYEVAPSGGPFSLGGDSGALVVTNTDGPEQVVGITIAGGRDKSLVLPLKPALKALGLTLVSGHNI
jgi:hypothetical protein